MSGAESDTLRERLRKIEALFAGAGTPGERRRAARRRWKCACRSVTPGRGNC
jgi:hypothetical protein